MLRLLIMLMAALTFVGTFSAQAAFPVITPENAAQLRPLTIFASASNSGSLTGFSEDNRYLITQGGIAYDLETGSREEAPNLTAALYEPPYTAEVTGRYYDQSINIIDRQTKEIRGSIKPGYTISTVTTVSPDGKLLAVSNSEYVGGAYYNGGILLYDIESHRVVARVAGSVPVFSADGTLMAAQVRRHVVIYAVNAPPLTAVLIPADVIPNMINLRAAPSSEAAILRQDVRGTIRINGLSPDRRYAYVPDLGGWVRAGEGYLRLPLYFCPEWLPTLDFAVSTPPPTPTATATATMYPTRVRPTATPTSTPVPVYTMTPLPTVQGAVPIQADNLEDLELLAVLDGTMCTRACTTSRSGFSLNGEVFITQASKDQPLRSYSMLDFELRNSLKVEGLYPVSGVSLQGKMAYFNDADNLIHVYDVQSWTEVNTMQLWTDISALHFTPHGDLVYNNSNGYRYQSRGIYESNIRSGSELRFSPDFRLVAVVNGADTLPNVYDITLERGAFRFPVDVQDVHFAPDGKSVATRDDNFVRLWDLEGNTVTERARIPVYYNASMQYRPDGEVLAVVTAGEMRLYDAQTAELLQKYPGAGSPGYNSDFTFSPDSRWLVMSPPLRLIDTDTGSVYAVENEQAAASGNRVLFSPDGNRLLVGTNNQIFVFGIPE